VEIQAGESTSQRRLRLPSRDGATTQSERQFCGQFVRRARLTLESFCLFFPSPLPEEASHELSLPWRWKAPVPGNDSDKQPRGAKVCSRKHLTYFTKVSSSPLTSKCLSSMKGIKSMCFMIHEGYKVAQGDTFSRISNRSISVKFLYPDGREKKRERGIKAKCNAATFASFQGLKSNKRERIFR
jgi:hypothetical protein